MDYKWNININQRAAVELGLNVDLKDLAIFDYIKSFILSNKCTKIDTPEGTFYWVSHKNIQDSMPLLNIKSDQGIINRVKNLIDNGLLIKYSKCEEFGKTLYAIGPNYDRLEFFETHQENLRVPTTKVEGNILLNNNTPNDSTLFDISHKDSIIIPKGGVEKSVKRFVKPTIEQIKAYCEEHNNGIDAEDFYYFYESKGWRIGTSPMKDWKAAVRTWESKRKKMDAPKPKNNVFVP